MTDYLAKIAARTVLCLCPEILQCNYCREHNLGRHDTYAPNGTENYGDHCPQCTYAGCKEGRVLDPRFEGLREDCNMQLHIHERWHIVPWRPMSSEKPCPGYTVNRDLAVLLTCIFPIDGAFDAVRKVMGDKELHRLSLAKGADVFTEAAAKAVYSWLEAEIEI